MQRIGPNKTVKLYFSLYLDNGDLVDETPEGKPAEFEWGDGSLLPGFEKALNGLKAGDERTILIDPKRGFGLRQDDNIQKFKIDHFKGIVGCDTLEPGLMVNFADASKAELPGVVQAIEDDYVVVDFNHPLAGKDLTFKVKIIEVADPASPVKIME